MSLNNLIEEANEDASKHLMNIIMKGRGDIKKGISWTFVQEYLRRNGSETKFINRHLNGINYVLIYSKANSIYALIERGDNSLCIKKISEILAKNLIRLSV